MNKAKIFFSRLAMVLDLMIMLESFFHSVWRFNEQFPLILCRLLQNLLLFSVKVVGKNWFSQSRIAKMLSILFFDKKGWESLTIHQHSSNMIYLLFCLLLEGALSLFFIWKWDKT
jgi:hypothetical protein